MTTLVRDIDIIRDQFPILQQEVNGKPLVYFDNAATAQKPRKVIDAISDYYSTINSNVHRGVHTLSQRATDSFEGARTRIAKHLNAGDPHQIIFTRGTTEGINLIAYSFGQTLKSGDEIILSALEHHSNIVPWQMLAERKGLTIKVIPMNDAGELDMEVYASLLSKRTALVSVNHISNALGTINPVEEIISLAHEVGAVVHIDGAQSVPHMKVDLQKLDVDLYTFSAHKAYGPTGFGVLFGKRSLLEAIPPFHGGGEMIETVTFEKTTYAGLPHKFEAGT
ncbi:MAG: aminotransferase class V-fold PLP-dependent enzyme, partial [Bacteroidota bacterium]|nr:aminotransferase class V-fold PLP-dependent enzyme [Bacteroidota bacterium]